MSDTHYARAFNAALDALERRHERRLRKKIEVEEVVIGARRRGEQVDPRMLASFHAAIGRYDEARLALNAAVREYEKARKLSSVERS